jgi:hypothetical protein
VFKNKTIIVDKSFTIEKSKAIKLLYYELNRFVLMKRKEEFVKIIKQECLEKLYCEYCIRNYLKAKFLN